MSIRREALRALFALPPMVTRERVQKVGAFRVQSHRVWSRMPVRDARFIKADECTALARTYGRRWGRD